MTINVTIQKEKLQTFPTNDDAVQEYIERHLLNYFHKIFSLHGQSEFLDKNYSEKLEFSGF